MTQPFLYSPSFSCGGQGTLCSFEVGLSLQNSIIIDYCGFLRRILLSAVAFGRSFETDLFGIVFCEPERVQIAISVAPSLSNPPLSVQKSQNIANVDQSASSSVSQKRQASVDVRYANKAHFKGANAPDVVIQVGILTFDNEH